MAPTAIVVVEDDAAIAELITMMLSEVPGYAAVAVGNGAAARDVIAQVTTDLVLLDDELPGLTGIEVDDPLHQRLGDAMPAVLFVSGSCPARRWRRAGWPSRCRNPSTRRRCSGG